jgi:hypothetical protein
MLRGFRVEPMLRLESTIPVRISLLKIFISIGGAGKENYSDVIPVAHEN